MNLTFKELKEKNLINGLDELSEIEGTRTDIYNAILKYNKLAVINCRESSVKINETRFLVLLKKVGRGIYKIKCFWDTTNKIETVEYDETLGYNIIKVESRLYFNESILEMR